MRSHVHVLVILLQLASLHVGRSASGHAAQDVQIHGSIVSQELANIATSSEKLRARATELIRSLRPVDGAAAGAAGSAAGATGSMLAASKEAADVDLTASLEQGQAAGQRHRAKQRVLQESTSEQAGGSRPGKQTCASHTMLYGQIR